METRLLLGCLAGLAIVSVFTCLCFAVKSLTLSLRHGRTALLARGERPGVVGYAAWRLRTGFRLFMPIARAIAKINRMRELADEVIEQCARHDQHVTEESVLSVFAAALTALFGLSLLFTGNALAACAIVACAVAIALVVIGSKRDKRREQMREEVPNAIESMAACFGSGFTLMQTLQQVSSEVPGALGQMFARGAHELETGGSANRALAQLRDGSHMSELAFVAVALDVQHQSGGTLRQVLDAASDSVKGELALRRSLRVQTAQAKLSARVVVVMPFVLLASFSLASPDFLSPFFSSVAGYALLGLAAIMQAAGILLVKRALAVDGVS